MAALAREELAALAAIYCGPEECEVLAVSAVVVAVHSFMKRHQFCRYGVDEQEGPHCGNCAVTPRGEGDLAETHGVTFRIQITVKELLDTDVLLKLLFHLPVNYPSVLPDISVNSDQLTRAQCMDVKDKLLEQAKKHLSEPMVHELILWVQQHLKYIIRQSTAVCSEKTTLSRGAGPEDGIWILFLHLDHMRAKAKYVKTVEKWASDLRLTGRLMFMGKIILILLEGDRSNIKEYLILQKTSKVDVDSSRKKCKEKMISVLCETKIQPQHARFQTFEVKDYSTIDELQKEFEAAGLATLFSEFVPPLLK